MSKTFTISATEFRKNYGLYAARATGGATIIITKYGRPTHVFMSYDTYRNLRQPND